MVRNGTGSSSTPRSPVTCHVVVHREGQPGEIVGEPRAHAPTALRMPPVLHVTLHELPAGGSEEVGPCDVRGGVEEGHRILELIAKAVGPAALVQARAAPHPAGERLVQEPAVQQGVEGGLGRAHLDDREPLLPAVHRPVDRRRRLRRAAEAIHRLPRPAPPTAPHRGEPPPPGSLRERGRARTGAPRTDRAPHRCDRSGARCQPEPPRLPWRPRNSRRSAVWACTSGVSAQKATQPANWGSKLFRAKRVPRAASNSVRI